MTELTPVQKLAWRRFLATEAGTIGMLYLRERTPSISKGLPHEIQFDAGVYMGYVKALDTVSEVISSEPVKEVRPDND